MEEPIISRDMESYSVYLTHSSFTTFGVSVEWGEETDRDEMDKETIGVAWGGM